MMMIIIILSIFIIIAGNTDQVKYSASDTCKRIV